MVTTLVGKFPASEMSKQVVDEAETLVGQVLSKWSTYVRAAAETLSNGCPPWQPFVGKLTEVDILYSG